MSGIAFTNSSYYFGVGGLIQLKEGKLEFNVHKLLGSGGQGQVYLGKDRKAGVLSAIKLMDPVLAATREDLRKAFEYEGQILGNLGKHSNIIELKFMGCTVDPPNNPVLVMEYVPGETLQDALNALGPGGRLPLYKVAEIGRQAAAGLLHGHLMGVVQLDTKPSNLFIYRDLVRNTLGLKVLDWGANKLLEELAKGQGTEQFCGTPSFGAPEQLLGSRQIWITADIFSLGVVLYVAASGEMPFGNLGPSYEEQLLRVNWKPIPISKHGNFPPVFVDLLDRMLDPDPKKRPQSMLEVSDVLRLILLDCSREIEPALSTEQRAIKYTEDKEPITRASLCQPIARDVPRAACIPDNAHNIDTQAAKRKQNLQETIQVSDPSPQDVPLSPSVQAEIQRAQEEAEAPCEEGDRDMAVDPIRVDPRDFEDPSPPVPSDAPSDALSDDELERAISAYMASHPEEEIHHALPAPPASVSRVIATPIVIVSAPPNVPTANPPVPSGDPIPRGKDGTLKLQPVPTEQTPIQRGKGWTLKMDNPGLPPPPPPEWNQPPAPAPRGKGWIPIGNSVLVDKSPGAWDQMAPAQPKSEIREIQDRPSPPSPPSRQPAPPLQDPQPTPPAPAQQPGTLRLPEVPTFKFLCLVWRQCTLSTCIDVVFLYAYLLLPTLRLRNAYLRAMNRYISRPPRWNHLSATLVGTFLLLIVAFVVFLRLSASPARAPVTPSPSIPSTTDTATSPSPLPPPESIVPPMSTFATPAAGIPTK